VTPLKWCDRKPIAPCRPPFASSAAAGFRLVGLEQTTNSVSLYDYRFVRRTALIAGNERQGLEDDVLALLDDAVEIPVYGLPYSYNVSSATDMALYQYCLTIPQG
jgi:tRNA G18 (ribose-2'-O)-methylase SpoU